MSEPDSTDPFTPVYEGFRQDCFLAWLEGYGVFCIPNLVARVEEGELVLYLLDHVGEADVAEIRRRLGEAKYHIADSRLTLEQIEEETGFRIPA
jgi:hypothetical protein